MTEAHWAIAIGALAVLMISACVFGPALAEALIKWDRRRPSSPWYRAPEAETETETVNAVDDER